MELIDIRSLRLHKQNVLLILFYRQLYLDIKKQIEEIDESKKEQVGVEAI